MFWSWLNLFSWNTKSVLTEQQVTYLQKRNQEKILELKRKKQEKIHGVNIKDEEIESLAADTIRYLKMRADQGTLDEYAKYTIGKCEFVRENGVDIRASKNAKMWPESVAEAIMPRMASHFPSRRLELSCDSNQCCFLVNMKKMA